MRPKPIKVTNKDFLNRCTHGDHYTIEEIRIMIINDEKARVCFKHYLKEMDRRRALPKTGRRPRLVLPEWAGLPMHLEAQFRNRIPISCFACNHCFAALQQWPKQPRGIGICDHCAEVIIAKQKIEYIHKHFGYREVHWGCTV